MKFPRSELWRGPGSRVKGGVQCYNIGGYYSEARLVTDDDGGGEGGGRWVRTVVGQPNIRHGFPHTNPELEGV